MNSYRKIPFTQRAPLTASLPLYLVFLLSFFTSQLSANELTEIEKQKVITLWGADMPDVVGESIRRVSLEVVRNGKFYPIPSQIDEMDVDGNVYFRENKVPLDGNKGIIDNNDQLLFMLKDTGEKIPEGQLRTGGGVVLKEIELTTKNGKRYAYIVKDSKLTTDVSHVRYSNQLGLLETDYYSITVSPKNALNWDDFQFFNYEGHQDSPLDTMKLRFKSGVVTKWTKVTLTNKNLVAKAVSEQVGPIRATAQFKITVYLLKLPIMRASAQAYYYPHGFDYAVRLKIPTVRRKLLRDPAVYVSFDGNELNGANFTTALGHKNQLSAVVDGKQSIDEIKLMETGVTKSDNWIWVKTNKNLDWVSFAELEEESTEEIAFFVEDDPLKKDAPERFLGQSPNIGYKFTEIPKKGWVRLNIKIFMSESFNDSNLASELTELREIPQISINSVNI